MLNLIKAGWIASSRLGICFAATAYWATLFLTPIAAAQTTSENAGAIIHQ